MSAGTSLSSLQRIFISTTIDHLIAVPDEHADSVVVSDRIIDEITKILASKKGGTLFAVIFIDIDDYEQAYALLKSFKPSDLAYRIVAMDPENRHTLSNMGRLKYIHELRTTPIMDREFIFLVRKSFDAMVDEIAAAAERQSYQIRLMDAKHDQEDLISIGKSLSLEKDPDKLLRSILFLSKRITGADAGSIYLVEDATGGGTQLRFKYSHTFSKEIPMEEFVIPYDTNSIAGYVAITGTVLNIPDVYELSTEDPITFNSNFDRTQSYRSKSMLVVPMRNHIDEIIGVIQLINSKENLDSASVTGNEAFEVRLTTLEDFETKVVPFDHRYESLMEAVASQAAIAIENNRMIRQIENQFEEFVRASVTAIESRDVATSGHSFRVAEICTRLAHAVNQATDGPFKHVNFNENAVKELEYAALLHDFGKVYIDIAIFMKGKKLFPKEFENLILKMNYLYRSIELNYSLEEAQIAVRGADPALIEEARTRKEERERTLAAIKVIIEEVRRLNEPAVTVTDIERRICEIDETVRGFRCYDIDGNIVRVLTDDEKTNLGIPRGSLNESERREIESHVVHTYNFVSKIPWPPEFKRIPEIALKHHEKLDGSGYPNRLTAGDIPIQAKMMAIADIYDALTASDRPYKKALPAERALSILDDEAKHNKIDPELFRLFVEKRIYEQVGTGSVAAP
ncbi:MAG TPA: HD domain-containing phosphohydrolase [Spirochaetota bacterium]|nr:HD domain-containing phosphohydrolase [Spirochaetota bacterium]HOS41447.1 HD domain-containing phosphohydrolase [Spirochaetota bacterium]HPU87517.1 HD domain-containing phosphohydrolase [Spirochaetota bacterium]